MSRWCLWLGGLEHDLEVVGQDLTEWGREGQNVQRLQTLLLVQKEAVPQGNLVLLYLLGLLQAEGPHNICLLHSSLCYLNKKASGRRQEAGGNNSHFLILITGELS